jgi:hypothetical protein
VEALDRIEPWHLAVLAGLVAILVLAWGLWVARALRRIEATANELKGVALDHRRQFFAFAADQGWNDNMKLTQAIDPGAVAEGLRKSR